MNATVALRKKAENMTNSNKTLRNDIQSMRALAVIAVIIFHIDKTWLPGGFLGVDIFFVISGFVISNLIFIKKDAGTFSFIDFCTSRLRRIAPAYFALLFATSLLASLLLTTNDFNAFFPSFKRALFFYSNNYFATYYDYFGPQGYELPLLHTWSLAVEMQYYLFISPLLLLIPKKYRTSAILATLSILTLYASYETLYKHSNEIYYSLLARIPEFLIGSMVALSQAPKTVTHKKMAYRAGLILITLSLFFINDSLPFPGILAFPPCIGAALIIWSQHKNPKSWLFYPPLVFTGNISYSLYLWHWPILAGFKYYYGDYNLPMGSTLIAIGLIVLVSYASYTWVEGPMRRPKARLSPLTMAAVVITFILGSLVIPPKINHHLTTPLPTELTRYADQQTICHSQMMGDCIRGDRESNKEILMIGDSHAAQLNIFADVIGQFMKVRIRVITASSCVNIDNFDVERIPEPVRKSCITQTEEADKALLGSQDIVLAGRWDYQLKSPEFVIALNKFLVTARERNQRVFILAQVPSLTLNLQRAIKFEALGLHPPLGKNPDADEYNLKISEIAKHYPNVKILDYSHIELFNNAPFFGHTPLYSDSDHLNEVGARLYGEAVKERFARALQPPLSTAN